MAIKVSLRNKAIAKERHSLYLDFYPAIINPETNEPTRREFLGYYTFDKPKTPTDKQHNKETLAIAEQIRQRRDNEINKPEIYAAYEREQLKVKSQGEQDFMVYFKRLTDKYRKSNYMVWLSTYKYLETFTNGNLKFADLNEKFCADFRDYILTTNSSRSEKATLSQNSAGLYFSKLKTAMKQAFKDGYLQIDLSAKIAPIKDTETLKQHLTIEELNELVKTDCKLPVLKNAALFSALTGLRYSDIEKMVWGEIEFIKGDGYFINFRQQKTKGLEVMPISEQAYQLLGKRREATDKVFDGLKYSYGQNLVLLRWVVKAGITKDITFHCFRHTFATLQLSSGTDIYTVSKMLGHKELKTKQVYAKIVDKTKRAAADKIKLDF